MKRKLFMTIIAVLIVCLTCGMLLVACNPDEGNNGGGGNPPVPETRPENSVTMMTTVWNQIASSINVGDGKKFIADFDIALNIDDETEANNDIVYSLVGKASIDVNEGKESDIFIELKATKNGESKVLFGFAYDVEKVQEADVPFIYVSAGGSEYKKINGFYLTQLVADIQNAIKNAGNGENDGKESIIDKIEGIIDAVKGFMDPELIFPTLAEMGILAKNGTISDYGKTFTVDVTVAPIFNVLGGLMTDDILSQIGLSVAQLDSIAKEVAGFLGFEGIETFAQLCSKIGDALKFLNTQLVFKFDDNGVFTSAAVNLDYNKNNDGVPSDFAKYTVSVNKAVLNVGELDVFAGSSITDEVRNQKSVNLLNFSVKGSAVSYKGEEIAHRYSIEVQSDINPFELLSLIGDTSKENIVATLEKLGYFHLEINEVNENGDKLSNIITLHSKFDEGFAVANLNLNDAEYILPLPIGLGGVYDFGGLVDIIGMLNAEKEKDEATSAAGTDIFGMLSKLIAFFHVDNIATDGVTVDIKDLVVTLVESLGMTLDDTLNTVLGQVLDCDSINIKLETPTFGTCTTVDTASIESGIRTAKDFKTGQDFIKEIVSFDGLSTQIVVNDDKFAQRATNLEAGKCFEITGINLKGENVKTSGFLMAVNGLDVTKVGEQEVTFYVAIGSDIVATINTASLVADISVPDNIPINGVLVYTTTVNVVDFDKEAVVTSENLKSEVNIPVANGKVWYSKMKNSSTKDIVISINGEKYTVDQDDISSITKDGQDVMADVLENGMGIGTYIVKIGIGGYNVESKICVDDAYLEKTSEGEVPASIGLGETVAIPTYKVIVCNADGTIEEKAVEPTYKLDFSNKTLDELFDISGTNYTLKKNLDFVGKKFAISYKVALPSGSKELKVEIPITGPELKKTSTLYFGNTLNNAFGITLGDVVYSFVYENGKWIAKSEDGQTKALDITFEWTSAGSKNYVTFDANGFITNYNTADTKTSDKVYYTLTIDGYVYSSYFTAYELYALTKYNAALNSNLDGYINYVDKVYYEAEGEVKTLEFKYGAAGYGIYVKGTDTKVFNVKVTVFSGEEDVTSTVLIDGLMTQTGTYKVQYEVEAIYGTALTFSHNVTVKA